MKYYETNMLIIEFPTKFLGIPTEKTMTGRIRWKVAFTSLTGEKIQFISKGSKLAGKRGENGQRAKRNTILVDVYVQKEQFIDAISRYFSEKLKVRPQDLHFRFESPQPLGDLNASTS